MTAYHNARAATVGKEIAVLEDLAEVVIESRVPRKVFPAKQPG